jgi:endonuclease VIII
VPEGHTIHRLARDQQELVGQRVRATSPQGRFAEGAAHVDGATVVAVEAVGKHLLHRFDDGATVHVHLGMQGRTFRYQPVDGGRPPLKQVRLRLHAEDLDLAWDLIAPSACELLDDAQVHDLRRSLGPDPLDPHGFDHDRAVANLRTSGTTLGQALLDQHRIAGVGNVFRAEALLRARIHPRTPAADLTGDDYDRLLGHLTTMMKQAVDDAEIRPKLIYKQPTCQQCGTDEPTHTFDLQGRTAYACPSCQGAA